MSIHFRCFHFNLNKTSNNSSVFCAFFRPHPTLINTAFILFIFRVFFVQTYLQDPKAEPRRSPAPQRLADYTSFGRGTIRAHSLNSSAHNSKTRIRLVVSTTTDLQLLTQRLADIEPPPAVDWLPVWWLGAGLLALLLVLFAVYRTRRHTAPRLRIDPRRQALSELAELQTHAPAPRECAYRLAAILRRGLQLSQLDEPPPAHIDPQQWQALLRKLSQLRYQTASAELIDQHDLKQIETWLRGTPC